MKYLIAEKFKSIQGEGVYAGTPMAFIRFVGCSVGKKICSACDTDFEEPVTWRGGGEFSIIELRDWVGDYKHVCLTGGEPFDQSLVQFEEMFTTGSKMLHIETSGTKNPTYLDTESKQVWVCVSPKPGFKEEIVNLLADEVKVIMPGLGALKHGNVINARVERPGLGSDYRWEDRKWPDLNDALRWANAGKTVFIQPRNERNEVNYTNLRLCQDIVAEHPQLRLSVQLHKILKVQ